MSDATQLPVYLPSFVNEKCAMVVWIVSFASLVILAFFVFVPLATLVNEAEGYCLLYAGPHYWGESSICHYIIALAVIFLCLCALRLTLLILKVCSYSWFLTDAMYHYFHIWGVSLVILCVDLLLLLLLLVSACLMSAGLSSLCNALVGSREQCSISYLTLSNGPIIPNFYLTLSISEITAWCSFIIWMMIVAVEAIFIWKNGTFTNLSNSVRMTLGRGQAASKSPDPVAV